MATLVFVLAQGQNNFFLELVDALREELGSLGVESSVAFGSFPPPEPGEAYVLLPPHEWYELASAREHVDTRLFRRTVFLCTEQPGTPHFDENVHLARDAGAVLDINRHSVRELVRRGVSAEHFQLGYTPRWDATADVSDRDVDAVFMGCATDRRLEHLGSFGALMWRWRCRFLISDNSRPNTESTPGFLAGPTKWSLLARSKVLLNIHQSDVAYFEWMRAIEAISNGCLPVCEHSTDFGPLVPGEHVIFAAAENLGFITQGLLNDDDAREQLAKSARDFLRQELPLRRAAQRLAELGEIAAEAPLRSPGTLQSTPGSRGTVGVSELRQPSDTTDDADISALKAGLKALRLDVMDLRREIAHHRIERASDTPPPGIAVDAWTPTWPPAHPRVSVLVTLFNYAGHIRAALDSLAACRYRELEVIIVDDASSDDSAPVVRNWLGDHSNVPALLLTRAVNQGLPHGRNAALGFARGEYCFMLDADNEVYPGCLDRLVRALEADTDAIFSYGILERFDQRGSAGLMNFRAWDPQQLRVTNFIDAMALIRADALRGLGGFTTDPRLHGWEDYALWCAIAEHGGHGVLVPEIVARYRTSATSMLALTNISPTHAYAVLAERNPTLMAGLDPPL